MKATVKIFYIFAVFALAGMFGKLVFLLANLPSYPGLNPTDFFRILGHGLPMDCSVAGYLTALPALMMCAAEAVGMKRWLGVSLRIWFAVAAMLLSLAILLDAALYPYWHFKLDTTPLFYFFTSPTAAMASAEWWQLALAPFIWLCMSAAIFSALYAAVFKIPPRLGLRGANHRLRGVAVALIAAAALFIPIRGGVTVSTMNVSRSYFSSDMALNHAAVNPFFSLLYSLTHQDNFARQFRYMDADKADALFTQLQGNPIPNPTDSLLSVSKPDIYIIILESFSSHLFPSLGGESVAARLDSIARQGLLFTDIYASSFRTDRGIPAILSAFPGQPDTSVMKFVKKTEHLPGLAAVMRDSLGYDTRYFYGGDANFTNMQSYLIASGVNSIISDKDFPLSSKLSKWGAHDDVLFDRVKSEVAQYKGGKSVLNIVQTSSSHEPFQVPGSFGRRFADDRANAFAFADSCAASFINWLASTPRWQKSLVIAVPDHYGAWPELDNPTDRHRIPVIMTGGALARKGRLDQTGSQTDIAATILSALGVNHGMFPFSNNLLDCSAKHFAFFSQPGLFAMKMQGEDKPVVYDYGTQRVIEGDSLLLPYAQAYIQKLYDALGAL